MLNGPFAMQQAGFFADRIKSECGSNLDAQVRCAFRLAFGRDPDNQELQQATDLVGREGLATLTRALLNANEFVRLN
jgi:hypothetical protein